jgi:putative oxidoreductase
MPKDLAMTAAALPASRSKTIVLWILRVLIAALFLFAGFMKVTGQPMMIEEFNTIGLGQWFRYFTGVLELAGAIAILVPSISVFGAIVLLAVDVGAFVTQIAILHGDWIHTLVIGAILAAAIYLQRHQFGSLG